MAFSLRTLSLCLALFASVAPAAAADLVVVKSSGIDLSAGQAVDGRKPLTLKEGEQVVLISSSGQIVKLRGPWAKAPLSESPVAGPDAKAALKALLA